MDPAREAQRELKSSVLLALAMVPLLACAPVEPARLPPPLAPTPESTWKYGAYLLSLDAAAEARPFLERLAGGSVESVSDPSLYLRDLAEVRLFTGDPAGAAAAARLARARLALVRRSAQFQADDRLLFERTVDALEAAGADDLPRLTALAADEGRFPAADAWYLLAWRAERAGDTAAARTAYRAFLERAPRWSFLRRGVEMRQHAQRALR